jgi:hypothetical protein
MQKKAEEGTSEEDWGSEAVCTNLALADCLCKVS